MESVYQLFVALLIFVIVIALTYITTRWIAQYQKNQQSGSNIHVIETLRVSTNKFIAIIEVGGEYFLIGLGKDEITPIGKLDGEDLILDRETPGAGSRFGSFKDIITAKLKKDRQSDE